MGKKLKIAAVQMDCTPAPVQERLARATERIAQASHAEAQLAVMPELFNAGYEFHERNYALAELLDGETVTWMKSQAAQHNLHIAGSLLLRDNTDIYNAALLVAPDGQLWRYDKHYVPLWERAYSRGGHHITVADTCLGKLGMLICWDQFHPDLWAQYAGNVHAMVIMSCPGDIASGDLVFPDGFRSKFMTLVGPNGNDTPPPDNAEAGSSPEPPSDDSISCHQQAAWIGVPVVEASATGTIRTKLPLIEGYFAGSPLEDRVSQASDMILECGFPPATRIASADGKIVARGTPIGDSVIFAEVELPEAPIKPATDQPDMRISQEMYQISDEIVPSFMIPLYDAAVNRPGSVQGS